MRNTLVPGIEERLNGSWFASMQEGETQRPEEVPSAAEALLPAAGATLSRIGTANSLFKSGGGWRRMNSQTAGNSHGKQSWDDLLTGLMGTHTRNAHVNAAKDVSKLQV